MQTDAKSLASNSQLCWMLHVASVCTPCCMSLDVVACCCAKFETGQPFSYVQTDATTSNNVGSCWPKVLHPFAQGFKLLREELYLHILYNNLKPGVHMIVRIVPVVSKNVQTIGTIIRKRYPDDRKRPGRLRRPRSFG